MQRLIPLLAWLALLFPATGLSQITFFDQTAALLPTTNIHSGAPMGIADMNGDNLDDIVRLSSANHLFIAYQTPGGGMFTELYYGDLGSGGEWSLCIADVDENGFNDIIAGGAYNHIKLLKANASGTNYTQSNLPNPNIFLQGSNFVDINNDGTVDIFACHDDGLSAPFNNDGNGNFTYDLGLIDASSTTPSDNSGNYGSVWTDYDGDGDLDMYLSKCRQGVSNPNDGRRKNLLFQNDGSNNFVEVAPAAGLQPLAQSWAADFADIDNDGDMDCFVVNHDQLSILYENNGDGTFSNITAAAGMSSTIGNLGLGIQCIFDDFDNDGFVDLLATSGSLSGTHLMYRNNGNQTFTSFPAFPTSSRIHSAVTGDLNNDGFLDVYAGFGNGFNSPGSKEDILFINNSVSGNNWVKVKLKGTTDHINAIGAIARLYGPWGVQTREVRAGEGYGIMNAFTLHFGIGTATHADSLVIEWHNGAVEKLCGISANSSLVLEEGNFPDFLTADFDFTINGLTVDFTDLSEGWPDQWIWDFGDGNGSGLQNPSHTYSSAGTYIVRFRSSNDCGSRVEVMQVTVGVLPVNLLSFDAQQTAEGAVHLSWEVEQEIDFDRYEIERATGQGDFSVLTSLAGNGAPAYSWLDRLPPSGTVYYRLKMVDLDGSFSYSPVEAVHFTGTNPNISTFPNPIRRDLQVQTTFEQIDVIYLSDKEGRRIREWKDQPGNCSLNLSSIPPGIYILEIRSGGNHYYQKVIRQ